MAERKVCDHQNCTSVPVNQSVCQTLSEMDWERGIWNAASTGDKKKIENLLQKSSQPENTVNEPDNSGYTALHYAARRGHTDICKLLLQFGAFINTQTRSGQATPLHKAAVGGKLDTVRTLLELGASPTAQDIDGETALHKAAQKNHEQVVKFLLEACPELAFLKDRKGNAPMLDKN